MQMEPDIIVNRYLPWAWLRFLYREGYRPRATEERSSMFKVAGLAPDDSKTKEPQDGEPSPVHVLFPCGGPGKQERVEGHECSHTGVFGGQFSLLSNEERGPDGGLPHAPPEFQDHIMSPMVGHQDPRGLVSEYRRWKRQGRVRVRYVWW